MPGLLRIGQAALISFTVGGQPMKAIWILMNNKLPSSKGGNDLLAPGCGLPQGKLPFMSVIRVFPASNGASSHLRVKATERKVGLEQVPSNWNAAKKLSSSTLATQTFCAQLQKAPTLLCLFGLKTRQSKQRQPFLKACNFFKTTDVQTSGHRTLCKSSAPCTTGPFCL